jgi:hypothetical protein
MPTNLDVALTCWCKTKKSRPAFLVGQLLQTKTCRVDTAVLKSKGGGFKSLCVCYIKGSGEVVSHQGKSLGKHPWRTEVRSLSALLFFTPESKGGGFKSLCVYYFGAVAKWYRTRGPQGSPLEVRWFESPPLHFLHFS